MTPRREAGPTRLGRAFRRLPSWHSLRWSASSGSRAWIAGALLTIALALYAASASARPGGGHTFGGRSGSSSSGGGRGGGGCDIGFELVYWLLRLTFTYPAVGIPLDIVVLVVGFLAWRQYGNKQASWSTSSTSPTTDGDPSATTEAAGRAAMLTRPSRAIRRDLLSTVGRVDPDFSIVLFEDFVYALFAATHEARGKSQLATLAPYLRADVRQQLEGRSEGLLTEVKTPVIGAMRYVSVSGFGPRTPHEVTIELEANYTEVRAGGAEQTFYVVEQWSLVRAPTARSRPPDKASIIGCPCCGAPLSELRGNTCGYCKQVVDTGAFDWVVASIDERDRMERPPQLTADAPEAGTSLPTVVEPDARMRLQLMSRRDPAFQWPAFLQRVSLIHAELQPAWSTLEWTRARPFVSDPLFQMLAYWIESYRRSHLRNVNENARITSVELAAVISDKWFDAITVRVHATGLDYTVTDEGRVVSGSRSRERPYSEYWTLIRRSGASTKPPGSVGADGKECPNCGAPLAINMAGSCTYCRAKVTSGDFDWVLSRIEQDEAYSG